MGNDDRAESSFTVPTEKIGFFAKLKRNFVEAASCAKLQQEIKELLPPLASSQKLLARFQDIHKSVQCAHNPSHALAFIRDMLKVAKQGDIGNAVFVEAGCFKGGSTAKFSLVADLLGRPLHVFDSFEGLPDNEEVHDVSTMGHSIEGWFAGGHFAGQLDEVKHNIGKHGKLEVCEFFKGWFSDTMPGLTQPVAAAFCQDLPPVSLPPSDTRRHHLLAGRRLPARHRGVQGPIVLGKRNGGTAKAGV